MIRLLIFLFCPFFCLAQTQVEVIPVWGTSQLVKGNWYYLESGDSVRLTAFSVYVGKFNGEEAFEGYHLLDAFNSSSLTFTLPVITSNQLSFVIGVDSLACTAGVLEGDLDPARGMYWAWNTGYIHAKMQGNASRSKDAHKEFEFHIGGYLRPNVPLQRVTLTCGQSPAKIVLYMDASLWFKGPYTIDLAKVYHVVDPGREALHISENYKNMFRLKW
jgi:hypothetical protein